MSLRLWYRLAISCMSLSLVSCNNSSTWWKLHASNFLLLLLAWCILCTAKMYAPQNNQAQRRPKFKSRSTTFIITPTTTILWWERGFFLSLFGIAGGPLSHYNTRTSQNSLNWWDGHPHWIHNSLNRQASIIILSSFDYGPSTWGTYISG